METIPCQNREEFEHVLKSPDFAARWDLERFLASRFADELPDSELRVFDDAGHFVWEDEPAGTTAALVDFLERRVPRA